MKMLWSRALCLAAAAISVPYAEFSPLSTHPEGFGLPVAPMGSRERGMGEGGLAAVSAQGGFHLHNASRSAFHEKTTFLATLEGDVDRLRDNSSSTLMGSGALPTLATLFKTPRFGTFGAYYQQGYLRNFEAHRVSDGTNPEQRYFAEGGLYVLGLSWAYAPLTWLALGVAQNFALGSDRFIRTADFSGIGPPEAEPMEGDTLERRHRGAFPSVSVTVRNPRFDAAMSYTHSSSLSTTRERRTSGMLSDPLSDTTGNLPAVLAAGAAWKLAPRQTALADVTYEHREQEGVLNPAWQASVGYELRGSANPLDRFRRRVSWRAGAGYKTLYLREVPEYFATVGTGLPLGPRGHQLDLALKVGHRSFDGSTFFAEDYVKLSASVVGVSVWGQPARKRR